MSNKVIIWDDDKNFVNDNKVFNIHWNVDKTNNEKIRRNNRKM